MKTTKTVRIYEVVYDTTGPGPAGDGTVIYRSRSQREAEAWAASHTCYGRPAEALAFDAPRHLAVRWGCV